MIAFCLIGLLTAQSDTGPRRVIDDFERVGQWTAQPAEGVRLAIRNDIGRTGRAMRLDFAFTSGGGYAIAHRPIAIDLPSNYVFSFWMRAVAPPNTLEFKLIDAGGENVWWYTERDRTFDGRWHQVTVRRRQIAFAWGPAGGGEIHHVAALELVITAGRGGGSGQVWFDDLTLASTPAFGPYNLQPGITASSALTGHGARAVIDGDTMTSWQAIARTAALTIDFLRTREFGGLTVAWEPGRRARRYAIQTSDNGRAWRTVQQIQDGSGDHDLLYLPDTESRYLRLTLDSAEGAHGFGLREVTVHPLEWSVSRNAFFEAVARDAPRGAYPRYLAGQRANWTVVSVDGAGEKALLNEDGSVDVGSGQFSVEPFLRIDGKLLTWNDVTRSASLEEGRLPIPSVRWHGRDVALTVTAFAVGSPSASSAVVRYRVVNGGAHALRGMLYAAIRPFQVNPPWQFLGTPGGTMRIDSLRWNGTRLSVNGDRSVIPLTRPAGFGATAFHSGDIAKDLELGSLPPQSIATDTFGAASGAFAWPLDIAPGDSATIAIELPLGADARRFVRDPTPSGVDRLLAATVDQWRYSLDRATISMPPEGNHFERTISSALGQILESRDGAALQPGTRAYARSWIRDGALMSAALLRFGHADAVKDFLIWYAKYQYPGGKIPCCVDRRGADPISEHDSDGEFIYLVAEYFRHTGDRATLELMWPQVLRAAGYLDSLRRTERTAGSRQADGGISFGLLPPSISHEGYSAKPMHSYWDDFLALRGFKDAAAMARVLGLSAESARLAAIRDQFATDLYASIDTVMARRKIDFIPGAADLGDFDATSTTIAVSPGGELGRLPDAALRRTFERYWSNAKSRLDGTATWEAYTPYELRTVGTMLRLGWKDRASTLLDGLLRDQEPAGWNQWPEVVWKDPHAPKFIGDLPHAWVASDFLRSASDLFVYERESDSALVIAAGIPSAWLVGHGVDVHALSTWWGLLSYTVTQDAAGITVQISSGIRVPPGGLLVFRPGDQPARRVTVNGSATPTDSAGSVVVRAVPATIVFRP
jgi:hypothetical protein